MLDTRDIYQPFVAHGYIISRNLSFFMYIWLGRPMNGKFSTSFEYLYVLVILRDKGE